MITVERIRDDSEKRILRCSEGNRVWYQMGINPRDMMRIELLLGGRESIRLYLNGDSRLVQWIYYLSNG